MFRPIIPKNKFLVSNGIVTCGYKNGGIRRYQIGLLEFSISEDHTEDCVEDYMERDI